MNSRGFYIATSLHLTKEQTKAVQEYVMSNMASGNPLVIGPDFRIEKIPEDPHAVANGLLRVFNAVPGVSTHH